MNEGVEDGAGPLKSLVAMWRGADERAKVGLLLKVCNCMGTDEDLRNAARQVVKLVPKDSRPFPLLVQLVRLANKVNARRVRHGLWKGEPESMSREIDRLDDSELEMFMKTISACAPARRFAAWADKLEDNSSTDVWSRVCSMLRDLSRLGGIEV